MEEMYFTGSKWEKSIETQRRSEEMIFVHVAAVRNTNTVVYRNT
jgi:hypothetical protein